MSNTVFGKTAKQFVGGPLGAVALSSAATSMLMLGGQSSQRTTTLKASQNASKYLTTAATNAYSQHYAYMQRTLVQHVNRRDPHLTSLSAAVGRYKSNRTFSTNTGASTATTTTTASSSNAATTATTTSNVVAEKGGHAIQSQGGFVQWYEHHLQHRPVTTKAVTGSILWGLGDVVAQVVPNMMHDDQQQEEIEKKDFQYDYPRTARAMFFGFGIHAPLSHMHYNFLEWMTVKGGFTGLGIPVFKTIMEQFVYWSWFSNSLYHGAMGAMQGKSLQQIYDRIADVLWDTQKAQWVFWIPVQLLNFNFVPVRHQLNVVLMTSVVWTALLSAWYPPEDEKDASSQDEETKIVKKQD